MVKIKVMILDLFPHVCVYLTRLLDEMDDIEVVGSYSNRSEGSKFIVEDSPNIILLDVNMVEIDELNVSDMILNIKNVPVIILSHGSIEETSQTVRAMLNGAVDFFKVPDDKQYIDEQFRTLVAQKIRNASKVKRRLNSIQPEVIKNVTKADMEADTVDEVLKQRQRYTGEVSNQLPIEYDQVVSKLDKPQTFVAIGTSTGGPRALHTVLEGFSKDFTPPIFIVQHMPAGFTKSLANRLDKLGRLHVKEAIHGEKVEAGTVYIAPGEYHMKVVASKRQYYIELNQEQERTGHRPSVNELFDSLACIPDVFKIIVVLTGMGKDGAEGVLEVKKHDKNAIVIAESKETAIINGMPQAAVDTKQVTEVVRLDEVCKTIINYVNRLGVG